MSVVNRIEVSNFLNLHNRRPSDSEWVPHWRHVVLNFRGTSAAVRGDNGIGKTASNACWYALLKRDPASITSVRERSAPKRKGLFTHYRVEVLFQSGVDTQTPGLYGKAVPGEPYVLGFFCFAEGPLHFYSYQGYLEDCPVARVDGHRRHMVTNDEFRTRLKGISSSRLDEEEAKWIGVVAEHFDPGILTQLLRYQKTGGGDGVGSFFKIDAQGAGDYDSQLFYQYIAPELLQNCMGAFAEQGELSFEDTLVHSARPVLSNRIKVEKTETELQQARGIFDRVGTLNSKADAYSTAKGDLERQARAFQAEADVLSQMVERAPIIGIPFAYPVDRSQQTAFIANRMVCQDGHWLIPDRVLAELFDWASGEVNRRAQAQRIEGQLIRGSQVIEKPVHLKSGGAQRDPRGQGNTGYKRSDCLALIKGRQKFIEGWDEHAAARAIAHAFDWHENEACAGEPNPFRKRVREIQANAAKLKTAIEAAKDQETLLKSRINDIVDRLQGLQAAEHVLQRMRSSGLFTPDELSAPASLEQATATQLAEARSSRERHEQKLISLADGKAAYQRVQPEFGDEQPSSAVERLDAEKREAEDELELSRSAREEIDLDLQRIAADWRRADTERSKLSDQQSAMREQAPGAANFRNLFPGEAPAGLVTQVVEALQRANQQLAKIQGDLSLLEEEISRLHAYDADRLAFEGFFGSENPRELQHDVHQKLSRAEQEITRLDIAIAALQSQIATLLEAQQALASVQVRFGHDVDVMNLEQHLQTRANEVTRQVAELNSERPALEAATQALTWFEGEFSGRAPQELEVERQGRFQRLSTELGQMQDRLNDLTRQRADLEEAKASPGSWARQIRDCIRHDGSSVYEVIDQCVAEPARRAELFVHFSHVLHCPVLETSDAAAAALVALDRARLEAPVFVRAGLETFCQQGELQTQGDLAWSFMAGLRTQQVRALIDPAEIQALKETLDAAITDCSDELAALEITLADLQPDSEMSVRIRAARRAHEDKAREGLSLLDARLAELANEAAQLERDRSSDSLALIRSACAFLTRGGMSELEKMRGVLAVEANALAELQQQLPMLRLRASKDKVELIQSMIRFLDAGGEVRLAAACQERETLRLHEESVQSSLPRLQSRAAALASIHAAARFEELGGWAVYESLEASIAGVEQQLREAAAAQDERDRQRARAHDRCKIAEQTQLQTQNRLLKWRDALVRAAAYLAVDGVAFDTSFTAVLAALKAAESHADQRSRFDFKLAQDAVDNERDPQGRAEMLRQQSDAQQSLRRYESDRASDEAQLSEYQEELPKRQVAASNLDRSIRTILDQYSRAQALRTDIPFFEPGAQRDESPHVQSVRALLEDLDAATVISDWDVAANLISGIADDTANFQIATLDKSIKDLKKRVAESTAQVFREMEKMLDECKKYLSSSEKISLRPDQTIESAVIEAGKLYRHFESYLLRAEQNYKMASDDLEKAQANMVRTVTSFADDLERNFRLLQQVLSRRGSASEVALKVDAQLMDKTAIKDQITTIISEVETIERRRSEDKERHVSHLESEREYDSNLKLRVRNSFYRNVFRAPLHSTASGPTIHFQHPDMADGRMMRLEKTFSTGQFNALGLFILIKLADFAFRRDQDAQLARSDRRSKSRLANTRVVLIDGLFSNLSDPKVIRSTLSALKPLKGAFQLIGWIHNPAYENDPDLFPTCINLRKIGGGSNLFVLVEDDKRAHDADAELPIDDEVKALDAFVDPSPASLQ